MFIYRPRICLAPSEKPASAVLPRIGLVEPKAAGPLKIVRALDSARNIYLASDGNKEAIVKVFPASEVPQLTADTMNRLSATADVIANATGERVKIESVRFKEDKVNVVLAFAHGANSLQAAVGADTTQGDILASALNSVNLLLRAESRIGKEYAGFLIEGLIGVGGNGEVYKARNQISGQVAAVKVLRVDDPERRARFVMEAATTNKLDHPNVVKLNTALVAEGGEVILITEYAGNNLRSAFNQGPLPLDKSGSIFMQVFDALIHAHERGIFHRDLKPENVTLNDNGVVKVIDLGTSLSSSAIDSDSRLTMAGEVLGTPGYAHPLVRGAGSTAIEPKFCDIFSLAVMITEGIVGNLDVKFVQSANSPTALSLASFGIKTKGYIDKVLEKGLKISPSDSYQSIAEFKAAFAEAMQNELGEAHIAVVSAPAEGAAIPQIKINAPRENRIVSSARKLKRTLLTAVTVTAGISVVGSIAYGVVFSDYKYMRLVAAAAVATMAAKAAFSFTKYVLKNPVSGLVFAAAIALGVKYAPPSVKYNVVTVSLSPANLRHDWEDAKRQLGSFFKKDDSGTPAEKIIKHEKAKSKKTKATAKTN